MIIVDADFLIGLFHKGDPHWKKAHNINKKIKEEIIISWDVIDEVATKLSYFGKKEIACRFLKEIFKSPFKIIFPDKKIVSLAIDIFHSQKFSHVSLTDCTNLAIMKTYKIKKILSFDKVYEKNGFSLVK